MLLLVSDVVFSNSKKKNNLLFEPKRVIIKTVWVLQSPGLSSWYQGRSQEETTTEANTRSVVRNQPYEIF